ncbi:MAG TPA: hypothetical protein VKN82_05005 [Desulfohalobiaceae bacterium]|nr:hypothetical protein [Desulfohalobiaceae bacterium]
MNGFVLNLFNNINKLNKEKEMNSRLLVCIGLILLLIFLIISCQPYRKYPQLSQVPVPTSYKLRTQKKMQALDHWKMLAEDVAIQIKKRIDNSLYPNKELYVTPAGTTDFEKNFRTLLISSLVKEKVKVTNQQGNHMLLNFQLDVLRHKKRMIVTKSGFYQTLSPDLVAKREKSCAINNYPPQECYYYRNRQYYPLVNVEAGRYTMKLPRNEVLVTTSLVYNSEYLFRNSAVYYINDKELFQYRNKEDKKYNQKAKEYFVVN